VNKRSEGEQLGKKCKGKERGKNWKKKCTENGIDGKEKQLEKKINSNKTGNMEKSK
jgi:hypothetical protein